MLAFLIALAFAGTFASCLAAGDEGYAGTEPVGAFGEVIPLSSLGKAAIGLQLQTVVKKPLSLEIAATGRIEPIPTREFHQQSLLSGRVAQIMVSLGDMVKAGQVLMMVDSPEINTLAAETLQKKAELENEIKKEENQYRYEIEQARAQMDLREANYKRAKGLFEEGIGSRKELQVAVEERAVAKSKLSAAETQKDITLKGLRTKLKVTFESLSYRLKQMGVPAEKLASMIEQQKTILEVPVTAARSGVITEIQATAGQSINQTVPLFKISDLSEVWATADVYEDDMSRMHLGEKVLVKVAAFPNETFRGKVTFIGRLVNPETRTLPVRVEISNPDGKLKPDMYADLYIDTTEPAMEIKVPDEAVVDKTGHHLVFVETQGGYQATHVKVGRHLGDEIEILEGLKPGDRIVVRGAFQLDAELLKEHGKSDLFVQATEGEAPKSTQKPEADKQPPISWQLIALLSIGSFVLGAIVNTFVAGMRKSGGQTESSVSSPVETNPVRKR